MINRRESLRYITLASISTGYLASCTPEEAEQMIHEAHQKYPELSEKDKELLLQAFFTDGERETVRQLANLILPADDRSPSAEETGVVEFIEFIMLDKPENQTKMRGGLKWMDLESIKRFGKDFKDIIESEQKQILDDIAYPDTAKEEFSHGVNFFNTFRDFVATGYFSSKQGVEDIGYMGNVHTVWQGAPQEWLDKLNVSYNS